MKKYLSEREAAKAIIDIGKRMYQRGMVAANDGNISVRIAKKEILATPSGVSKGFMKKKMLIVTDLDGNVIRGEGRPSSELKMHLRAYKEDPSIMSVCHAHPPFGTAAGISGIKLDAPILAEAVISLGDVPVLPYLELGSDAIPEAMAPYYKTHNAVILANHGVTTWGKDPYDAYYRMESVEYYARMMIITGSIAGAQNLLSKDEIDALVGMREKFGITRGGYPKVEN
ncbi:MAG: class II aldolase/adducin family protein [Lachnospiraceae bacterium]|nr:class II aldolase/adducin family protein [Lachnospiraceae bacterium]